MMAAEQESRDVEGENGKRVVDPSASWIVCFNEKRIDVVDEFAECGW